MRKFLLLLSMLCMFVACVACQTNDGGGSNASSQEACVEEVSSLAQESESGENQSVENSIDQSSASDSTEGSVDESTQESSLETSTDESSLGDSEEEANSEWADIEFPYP